MDISIIIVNYNTDELLYNALKSIAENISVNYEVIVADNGSTDSSFTSLSGKIKSFGSAASKIELLQLGHNYGFAKANNIAAAKARGKILHFLNPDTTVGPRLNYDYQKALGEPNCIYVNPLVNADNSLENDAMPLPFIGNILKWNFCRNRAKYWYKGASIIISKENFNLLGRWSEDYFIYSEDLDLFYMAWRHSIKIAPAEARIFHLGGGSSSAVWSSLEREVMVQRSLRLFYKKHSNRLQYTAVKLYYLFHYLLKPRHHKKIPLYLKAWHQSRKKE